MRYYSLDTGKGEAASVSIFKDKAGADESVHLAAEYVKEHLSKFITQKPEIIEGDQSSRLNARTISEQPVLGWCLNCAFLRANDLNCGRAPRRRSMLRVHTDDKLTAFLELESAIRACAGRLAAAPWSDDSYPKPLVEEIKCLRDQM